MDQRGDRRWAFHRIRQPNVQRKLRGFANRTAENQKCGNRQESGMTRQRRQSRCDLAENNRAGRHPDHQNPEHESEIADAIGDERFFRRVRRGVAIEPMADQHIGAKADQLPEDEQHHEIVRQNDAEHREHEERQCREIAGLACIIPHVAERIDMDQRSDARDHEEHRLAQTIEDKAKRDLEDSAEIDPGEFWCGDSLTEKRSNNCRRSSREQRRPK